MRLCSSQSLQSPLFYSPWGVFPFHSIPPSHGVFPSPHGVFPFHSLHSLTSWCISILAWNCDRLEWNGADLECELITCGMKCQSWCFPCFGFSVQFLYSKEQLKTASEDVRLCLSVMWHHMILSSQKSCLRAAACLNLACCTHYSQAVVIMHL